MRSKHPVKGNRRMSALLGGMAVLALFVGQILLLAPLSDKWSDRMEAAEAANPGQANLKAERLVRAFGVMILRLVHAVAWLSGLLVFPWLGVIVYDGSWSMLPAVAALTVASFFLSTWTGRNLEALDYMGAG